MRTARTVTDVKAVRAAFTAAVVVRPHCVDGVCVRGLSVCGVCGGGGGGGVILGRAHGWWLGGFLGVEGFCRMGGWMEVLGSVVGCGRGLFCRVFVAW